MKKQRELTRFEKARVIGARALQISRGAPITIKTKLTDSVEIAELELQKGTIPIEARKRKRKIY
jgi:DNA-directed RNA polymerase subunit K/omega